ncbi:hypothetical protein ACIPUN_03105 [Pectobacterium sp. CHL-2024]|uniref:hypothetical protein n=1 Tax=Pectobacterium sp. CHL-2024 TaxID=3377079 RepID=UPI0038078E80
MTISQVNNLKNVMAFVYIDDEFTGCAVIFKNKCDVLLVTAYHVISTVLSDTDNGLHRVKIENEYGAIYSVVDCKFCLEKDIALLYLVGEKGNLNTIMFFSGNLSPDTNLISRVKNKNMSLSAVLYSQEQVEQHNESSFIINVNKEVLGDSLGNWGANAMEGISGSGIFIKIHQHLILTGIIISIPDEGMMAKVMCSDSNGFLSLDSSLNDFIFSDYNYGRDVIINDINRMRENILDSTIDEWERNEINREYANNINRKLNILHKKNKLVSTKRKTIRSLMIGDYLYRERLRITPEFEGGYSYAHSAFCDKDMNFYAINRVDANNQYHKISDAYFYMLTTALRPIGLSDVDIQMLCNRDIAFWLANCDLDFLDENDD